MKIKKPGGFIARTVAPINGEINNTSYAEVLRLLELGWSEKKVYDLLKEKYNALGEDDRRFDSTFRSALNKFDTNNIKDPKTIRTNKLRQEMNRAVNDGNLTKLKQVVDRLEATEQEIEFTTPEVVTVKRNHLKIGSQLLDTYPVFTSSQTNIIAGESGSGKTTIALNLAEAFIINNNVDVLYANSSSENSDEDFADVYNGLITKKDKFKVIKFDRQEDPAKFFSKTLDAYKAKFGKYPDVMIIDTIEKCYIDAQNFSIKIATEAMATLSNNYPCCFIGLSQFSSTSLKGFKAQTKKPRNFPIEMQQGGLDVVNNIGQWISFKRRLDNSTTNIHLYFGKVRNSKSNQYLLNNEFEAPIEQTKFKINFKNIQQTIIGVADVTF